MTVLGSGNDEKEDGKSGDKAFLMTDKAAKVCGGLEATVLPGRARLVTFRRRRSILTAVLVLSFLLIMAAALFLTVCFVRKIGPFRRQFNGFCGVGLQRYNGNHRVLESYGITDEYALIHVPKFNYKHGSFESVRTLHVFDKMVTVIQYNGMCFVKPMMKYQMLRGDWFDKIRMSSHHFVHAPHRFAHFNLRMVHPQLPDNYLRDKVHHMADAICNKRPVFRLVFYTTPPLSSYNSHFGRGRCYVPCSGCKFPDRFHSWKMVEGKKCKVCQCRQENELIKKTPYPKMLSSNQVDPNCKTIRCENKCARKDLLGCVRCRCVDADQSSQSKPWIPFHKMVRTRTTPAAIISGNEIKKDDMSEVQNTTSGASPFQTSKNSLPFFASTDEGGPGFTKRPIFQERVRLQPVIDYGDFPRHKRSVTNARCKVLDIYEGYTPVDFDGKAPLDHVYDCSQE